MGLLSFSFGIVLLQQNALYIFFCMAILEIVLMGLTIYRHILQKTLCI